MALAAESSGDYRVSIYLDEAQVEVVTVDYFRDLGYEYVHGPVTAPDKDEPER